MKIVFDKTRYPEEVNMFDGDGKMRNNRKVKCALEAFDSLVLSKMSPFEALDLKRAINKFGVRRIIVEDKGD